MAIKTIFLDRDGVINIEKSYVYKISDFEFIEGVFESCRYLLSLHYKIVLITNQSGIGRGYYSENDFQRITAWMLSQFNNNDINILDVIHCPHLPSALCNCRKPKPGMLLKAKDKFDIDMKKSWMIGDKEEDILAANSANVTNTILVRSGHKINEHSSKAQFFLESIKDLNTVIKA